VLSMNSAVNEMDIEDIYVLRPGTVYKATGHAGEILVLKCEAANVTVDQLKHAKRAMSAVDSTAGQVRALTDGEKAELKKWVDFMSRVSSGFADNKVKDFESGPAAKDLDQVLTQQTHALWYKMPFSQLSTADKALDARMGQGGKVDKSGVKLFEDGLKAPDGLEQLGRIIAADLFIGNQDRFNPAEGSTRQYGGKKLNFKALKNIANIFLLGDKNGQKMAFSGHDFFDPGNGYRNVDMSLSDIREAYGEEWIGEIMCDKKTRKIFAKDVVADLEILLCPNRKRFSPRTKLGGKAAQRMETGMVDGMRLIVQQLAQKYNSKGGKWPAGVQQRWQAYSDALK
jgi:hypothetical protein